MVCSSNNEQVSNLIHQIIDSLNVARRVESREQAREYAVRAAHKYTGRSKIISIKSKEPSVKLTDDSVDAGNIEQLCIAIGESKERISAIMVESSCATPYFFKKVRELSSAEGALMLWDSGTVLISGNLKENNIPKKIMPDIFCFYLLNEIKENFLSGWYVAWNQEVSCVI